MRVRLGHCMEYSAFSRGLQYFTEGTKATIYPFHLRLALLANRAYIESKRTHALECKPKLFPLAKLC